MEKSVQLVFIIKFQNVSFIYASMKPLLINEHIHVPFWTSKTIGLGREDFCCC